MLQLIVHYHVVCSFYYGYICHKIKVCFFLNPGQTVLRKNEKVHLEKECAEQLVDCTNDDCKEQMKRKNLYLHVNNECDARIIECEFAKYGCSKTKIKANELKAHLEHNKFEHLQYQFMFMNKQVLII